MTGTWCVSGVFVVLISWRSDGLSVAVRGVADRATGQFPVILRLKPPRGPPRGDCGCERTTATPERYD